MDNNLQAKTAVTNETIYSSIILADNAVIKTAGGNNVVTVSAAGVPAVVADIQAPAGSIGLTELATIIQPSHVVKFVKLGSTITTTTLTGLAVGDFVIRVIAADGTTTVKLCAQANTLPDDPADADYIIVLRATV